MMKKAFGGLLALSVFTAPATVFAAPGHGTHKEIKNYIKQDQKRVNTEIKQVVKKEAEIAKQKAKLKEELAKKQRKVDPALKEVLQQIVKLEVKQAQDRKALFIAIAGNKFDAAQTALAALKANYEQIAALRAQLKNGSTPAPVPATPVPTTAPASGNGSQTPAPTSDTGTLAPTDNSGASTSTPTPAGTTPAEPTSTPVQS